MKIDDFKKRLRKDRPATTIELKIPIDVLDDLEGIARLRGFSNDQALIRAHIGQGLRNDLESKSSPVRGHGAFLNGYADEDNGLYDE